MCDVLKILIVEDQVDVQRVLDRLLTPIKTKFPDGEILFAENMAQAWQIIFQTPDS